MFWQQLFRTARKVHCRKERLWEVSRPSRCMVQSGNTASSLSSAGLSSPVVVGFACTKEDRKMLMASVAQAVEVSCCRASSEGVSIIIRSTTGGMLVLSNTEFMLLIAVCPVPSRISRTR